MYQHAFIPLDGHGKPCTLPNPTHTGKFHRLTSHQPGDTVVSSRKRRYIVFGDGSLRRMDRLNLHNGA